MRSRKELLNGLLPDKKLGIMQALRNAALWAVIISQIFLTILAIAIQFLKLLKIR